MCEHYNFKSEFMKKTNNNDTFYELVMEIFEYLPVACIINHSPKIVCLHSGISPEMANLDQLNSAD